MARQERSRGARILLGVQQVLMLVLGAAFVLFAVFNGEPVEVNLGFTRITAPLSLVILIPMLAGVVIGWLGAGWRSLRKRRRGRRQEIGGPAGTPTLTGDEETAALAPGEDPDWTAEEAPESEPVRREPGT